MYNKLSFYLAIICLSICLYSIYSIMNNTWRISPPVYILLCLAVLITILGAIGFKEKNKPARFRSWFTVILSSSLTILLFILLSFSTFFSVEKEFIKEIHSPDKNYKIDFYQTDAGAAGSFGIIGELNGPLWFKKRIYFQDDTKTVEIEWENNHIIIINDDRLNLKTT